MKLTRVVKKNGMYYPQYLKQIKLFNYRKWKHYTYTMSYLICTGFAEDEELEHYFDTKIEALHFIKYKKL